jgi:hypothetical protein
MKKTMFFCALFVMSLATNIYADPIAGQWTAMIDDSCFAELTAYNNKTLNYWVACYDSEAECFDIWEAYGSWEKVENGIYYTNYAGIENMLLLKGTVATTFNNTTLLKGVPLKKTKTNIYSNQCY